MLKSGANWQTAVKLFYRKARFYLDENHDFILEMAPVKYARIRIQIVRLSNGYSNGIYSPEPNACAKVRPDPVQMSWMIDQKSSSFFDLLGAQFHGDDVD